jgi:NAD(P)-dependent dehydrogenase (short-subunit alcohol dehydrogenase family)
MYVELDVTSVESVERAVATVTAELGDIDILVNNAGLLGGPAAVADIDDALFDRVLEVNVRGAVNCARTVSTAMRTAGRPGVIVNIASTASFRVPNPGTLVYTTSKHALNAVTKVLAVELGPHGIRVLDIAPTMVETPGIAELRARSAAAAGGTVKLGNADAFASLPLGRSAVPDDVARVVAFVVSDAAALMTGSTVAVDAGSIVAR